MRHCLTGQRHTRRILICAAVGLLPLAGSCGRPDPIAEALRCEQLYAFKKVKYWGEEVGNHKVLFNKGLGTCLALNAFNGAYGDRYWVMVIDMATDATVLHYTDVAGGTISNQDGSAATCSGRAVHYRFSEGGRETTASGCERTDLMGPLLERLRMLGFQM